MSRLTVPLLIFLLLFAGCHTEPPETGTPVRIYALAGPDDRSALAEYTVYCPEGGSVRAFALEEVLNRAPFPPGVTVTEFGLVNGVATVVLSEEAAPLTKFSLTLARACVVLTLTGLDGIDGVTLLIEGLISEPAVLRASDFVLGSLILGDTERTITLYFSDETGERSATETRTLAVRETDTGLLSLEYILKELIAGPRRAELRSVLPQGTELLSVIVTEGNLCTVNFSGEFVSNMEGSGIPPRMTLYCLVRSVTSQPGVSALKLLVDGQPLESYGTFDTSEPLTVADVRGD